MVTDPFEEKLKGYDDRFEVSGALMLSLPNDISADIDRLIFAWKLCNPDNDLSLQDLVLVLIGGPEEISKVLATIKGIKAQVSKVKKGRTDKRSWVMLKLHKEVLREAVASAIDEKVGKMPFFMMGTKRSSLVFDMMNYDIIATEV
jgi:hypothetical protein